MRIYGRNYFERLEIDEIEAQIENRVQNVYKKVKFYQNKEKNDGSYIVPTNLKKYLKMENDQELLKQIKDDITPYMHQ